MSTETKRAPRRAASRDAKKRPTSWKPPSLLPDPLPSEDWVFRWVRISSQGLSDASNLSRKLREGYTPVKIADHPELHLTGNEKGEAEFGGLVLCKIPREFIEQRQEHYSQQVKHQLTSVDNALMRESDSRMPLYNERRSQVTFGQGN